MPRLIESLAGILVKRPVAQAPPPRVNSLLIQRLSFVGRRRVFRQEHVGIGAIGADFQSLPG